MDWASFSQSLLQVSQLQFANSELKIRAIVEWRAESIFSTFLGISSMHASVRMSSIK
jgi:hypothetical protein